MSRKVKTQMGFLWDLALWSWFFTELLKDGLSHASYVEMGEMISKLVPKGGGDRTEGRGGGEYDLAYAVIPRVFRQKCAKASALIDARQ